MKAARAVLPALADVAATVYGGAVHPVAPPVVDHARERREIIASSYYVPGEELVLSGFADKGRNGVYLIESLGVDRELGLRRIDP